MLLSTSELFFVGLVRGLLSVDPLEPVPEEYTQNCHPDSHRSHCSRILAYAEACGLENVPDPRSVTEEVPEADLSTIQWFRGNESLAAGILVSVQEQLRLAAFEARRELQELDPTGEVRERFEELLSESRMPLYGHSKSSPQLVYGLTGAGDVIEIFHTQRMPQGILRNVLKILAPFIDATARIYLALGFPEDDSCGWWQRWVNSSFNFYNEVNDLNRIRAVEVIDNDLVGQSKDEQSFILGRNLGCADNLLWEIGDWLIFELNFLDNYGRVAQSLDFIPADPTVYENDPELASQSSKELKDKSPDSESGWGVEVQKIARQARVQVNLLGGVIDPGLESFCKGSLEQLLNHLGACAGVAKDLGLESVSLVLDQGIEITESLLNEGKRPDSIPIASWIKSQRDRRELMLEWLREEKLLGAVSLIFGELRLMDLRVELVPAGLGKGALQAWAELPKNARDTVREMFHLLDQGNSPYTVMNAAEPVLEVIVKMLVEQHLEEFHYSELSKMLYTLLQRAKDTSDKELECIASIGLGLRLLRNRVTHDAEPEYTKHDAAFFLNGLTVMLQSLSPAE